MCGRTIHKRCHAIGHHAIMWGGGSHFLGEELNTKKIAQA